MSSERHSATAVHSQVETSEIRIPKMGRTKTGISWGRTSLRHSLPNAVRLYGQADFLFATRIPGHEQTSVAEIYSNQNSTLQTLLMAEVQGLHLRSLS